MVAGDAIPVCGLKNAVTLILETMQVINVGRINTSFKADVYNN
jgi:hypothetical protein